MSTYQHIAQRAGHVHVRQLCRVLRVALTAYYAAAPLAGPVGRARLASSRARIIYSSQPALWYALTAGRSVRPTATPWAAGCGQRARYPQPAAPAAPNRLLDQPAPTTPNRVWVGNITYLPRQGGSWLYLAVWVDRCSRKVVGWERARRHAGRPHERGVTTRHGGAPTPGRVVHSDQGNQTQPRDSRPYSPGTARCKV